MIFKLTQGIQATYPLSDFFFFFKEKISKLQEEYKNMEEDALSKRFRNPIDIIVYLEHLYFCCCWVRRIKCELSGLTLREIWAYLSRRSYSIHIIITDLQCSVAPLASNHVNYIICSRPAATLCKYGENKFTVPMINLYIYSI